MLKLENVSKIYYTNGIVATGISKVNLELNIGEFVVITGESGRKRKNHEDTWQRLQIT